MYVQTVCHSTKPLDEFVNLVDPNKCSECPLMHETFISMDPADGSECTPLESPDEGWEQVLCEVVALNPLVPNDTLSTDLKFRFARADDYIGSTFELVNSHGDQIIRDSGYLVAQDLLPSTGQDFRRYSTMKAIWFSDTFKDYPPEVICPVWSISSAALMHACLGDDHG